VTLCDRQLTDYRVIPCQITQRWKPDHLRIFQKNYYMYCNMSLAYMQNFSLLSCILAEIMSFLWGGVNRVLWRIVIFKVLRLIYLSHLWAKCGHILLAIYVLYILPGYYVISVQCCVLSEIQHVKNASSACPTIFFLRF